MTDAVNPFLTGQQAAVAAGVTATGPQSRIDASHGVVGFFTNAFRDLKDVVTGVGALGGAVLHDVQHAAAEAVTLGGAEGGFVFDDIAKALPSAIAGDYASRYGGGLGNIAENIYEHPLSFLTDALTVATGGGALAAKVAGGLGKSTELVSAAGRAVGVADVASEAAAVSKGTLAAEDASAAARFVRAVQGTATPVLNPVTGRVQMLDPLMNPVKRLLYQKPYIKAITAAGEESAATTLSKQAELLAHVASTEGASGLQTWKQAEVVQSLTNRVLETPVPVMKTWAANRNVTKFADALLGKTSSAARAERDSALRDIIPLLNETPEGLEPGTVFDQATRTGPDLGYDGWIPPEGQGTRRSQNFAEGQPGSPNLPQTNGDGQAWPDTFEKAVSEPVYAHTPEGVDPELAAVGAAPPKSNVAEGYTVSAPSSTGEANDAFYIEGPQGEHAAVQRGTGDTFYMTRSQVPEGLQRQGLGTRLYEQVANEVKARGGRLVASDELSPEAAAFWKKAVARGDATMTPDGGAEWIRTAETRIPDDEASILSIADDPALQAARELAQRNIHELTPLLRKEFGTDAHVAAGKVKSINAIGRSAALKGGAWRNVDDISRFRVVMDSMFQGGVPQQVIGRLERSLGGKVKRIENTILRPDGGGERTLRVVMERNGAPIEVQLVTPEAAEVMDATSNLHTAIQQLAIKAQQGGPDWSDTMLRLEKARRLSEHMWEGVTGTIRESQGGLADNAVKKYMQRLRLAGMRHITDKAIGAGLDPAAVFDNVYMGLRIKNGAYWSDTDGALRGGSGSLQLDDLVAQSGGTAPMYIPMMDARRLPKRGAALLKSGQGIAESVSDVNLRKNTGYLLSHDLASKDLKKVFAVRMQRMQRAAESKGVIESLITDVGRPIRDWRDKTEGEVIISRGHMRNLFRTQQGVVDGALDAIMNGANSEEAVADALKRVTLDNLDDMPNLKDADLIAIPKAAAERINAHARAYFGDNVDIAFRAPTQMWKNMVLAGSPRWIVNNTLGNITFLKMQGGKLSDVIRQLSPKFRKAIKEAIGEDALKGVESGSQIRGLLDEVHPYSDTSIAGGVANHLQQSTRLNKTLSPFRRYADFAHRVNEGVEDAFRRASYLTSADKEAVRAGVKATTSSFWTSKKTLDSIFEVGLDEKNFARGIEEVNHYLNDYSQMTPVGRNLIRPYVAPFWGFYRHAAQLLIKAPFEHPGKTTLARLFGEAYQSELDKFGPLPSWLQGSIPIGGFGGGVDPSDMRFMSTRGPNPFNSILDQPANMMHPMWKMLFERASGRSSYTGKPFTAPDVVQSYTAGGQSFRMVRQPDGSIRPEPIQGVSPGLMEQFLQNIPQYETVKDLFAKGPTYDTTTLFDAMRGQGTIVDPTTGEPVYEKSAIDAASKLFGMSSTPAGDLPGWQERYLQTQEQALNTYLARQGAPSETAADDPTFAALATLHGNVT